MPSPFIALTLPANGQMPPQPIFVNALRIRSVNPRWDRKPGTTGPYGRENYDCTGTWITTGSGDECNFSVTESYGEVTGAIRDALP